MLNREYTAKRHDFRKEKVLRFFRKTLSRHPGGSLLIVPPFADIDTPMLGVHLLQAEANAHRHTVRILNLNFAWAFLIGEDVYRRIANEYPARVMLGEAIFGTFAYGLPPIAERIGSLCSLWSDCGDVMLDGSGSDTDDIRWLSELEGMVSEFMTIAATEIAVTPPRIVGCTTSFQQTSASVSILKALKNEDPDVITIIGGANCEGVLADGIASLSNAIDYVFSGESEQTFTEFLDNSLTGSFPGERIVRGRPADDLNSLAEPDFVDFFEQRRILFGSPARQTNVWTILESSRGCWWGDKAKCTFCGLNSEWSKYRTKGADQTLASLKHARKKYPIRNVKMSDNIMPKEFHDSLVPKLVSSRLGLDIFYEIKPNITLDRMLRMRDAGIRHLLAGIESLSTPLLRRMNKGVSSRDNVLFLRSGIMTGQKIFWNLLYNIPTDLLSEYEPMLTLIPLIGHLTPPGFFCPVRIDRFSKYQRDPNAYGIRNLRPIDAYRLVYPEGVDLTKLCYFFDGDYPSESRENPDAMKRLLVLLKTWWCGWNTANGAATGKPVLHIERAGKGLYLLTDTRKLEGLLQTQRIDEQQAMAALIRPLSPESEAWALENKVAIVLDGICTPLATSDAKLYRELSTPVTGTGSFPSW